MRRVRHFVAPRARSFVDGPIENGPARSGKLLKVALGASGAFLVAASMWFVPAAGASTSVSNLHAKAARIAEQIAILQTKLQVLSEAYDRQHTHLVLVESDIKKDVAATNRAEANVSHDREALVAQAVDAYVTDGDSAGTSAILSARSSTLPAQQAYLQSAAGSLDTAITNYRTATHALVMRTAQLSNARTQSQDALRMISQESAAASMLESQLASTLASVKGQEAQLVAAQQRRAAIQAEAQAAASTVIRQAISSSPTVAAAPSVQTVSDTGNAAGATAVKAAESQQGTPYEWGGSTPGVGFDCSGLVMWAWAQAGVSLPHSAAEQYADIAHVSFSDLQPGDLIFYASGGYIYHVIMYVGNGQAVQAEDFGTVVSITPVWPGAYAAGRP